TELHRHLARLTVLLLAVHLGALVADNWVRFGLADLLVPGASRWRPAAVAWGVVAMWLLVAVQVASWPSLRLRRRWWRAVHLLSYPAWCLAAVHAVLAGTDAASPLARALLAAMTTAVSFVVIGRLIRLGRRRGPVRPSPMAPLPRP
ncbi:MAG: ferric reductase-like transmembrane domain-containing protein, partial [Ilumatobacteraceae bacterium]